MWLKIAVPLLAAAYIGYRATLALEIVRAKRRGDTARLDHLRAHGFGFYRFVVGTTLVVLCLLALFLILETR
jgi:hypothetical protein